MNANSERILTYMFENRRQYSIPVYQRNYDWKRDNCVTLFDDIKNLINTEKKHFLGTIVQVSLDEKNGIKRYLIIDGQQRFTTLFLLIKALRDSTVKESEQELCDEKLFNIDKFKDWSQDEQSRLKLKPIKTDNEQLLLLMAGNIEAMDKSSNIYLNYDYFLKLIKELLATGITVRDFMNGMDRLECVMITLFEEKGDEPQVVFERINSTGLDLTLSDLIRNYILMTDEDSEHLYNEYWIKIENKLGRDTGTLSEYFIDYFNYLLPEQVYAKNAYDLFKKYALRSNLSHESILKGIYDSVEAYAAFIGKDNKYSEKINEKISYFRSLKQSTIYTFLLNVFSDFDNGVISEDVLCELLDFFISYTVRRYITGVPSNSYRSFYKSLYKRVFDDESLRTEENYLKAIYSFMLQLNTKDAVPSNLQFESCLNTEKIYEKDARICKFLLCCIENYGSAEKVEANSLVTIEHIMPQSVQDNWKDEIGEDYDFVHEKYLHTLGNLTLTGYNSELGTKSFNEKVEMMKDKNSKMVTLNKDVYTATKWTKKSIEDRAERLASILLKAFPLPQLAEQIKFENIKDNALTYNDVDKVRGTKPTSFICLGERVLVDSWSDMLTKLFNVLYELDSVRLEECAKEKFKLEHADRVYITYDVNDLRKPYEIKNSGILIETNLSSTNILSFIRETFDKYNLSDDDFIFYIE